MKQFSFPIRLSSTVVIRPFKEDDIVSLAKHANNSKIADCLNDGFPHPYTIKDARDFIQRRKSERIPQVLAIVINDEAAGAIGVFQQQNIQRKNAEIGYWISEDYWGKGIATASVKWMINYAFSAFDIIRLFGRPFPFNIASQKVLENCGFHREAVIKDALFKGGKLYDEWIYSLLKKEAYDYFS